MLILQISGQFLTPTPTQDSAHNTGIYNITFNHTHYDIF